LLDVENIKCSTLNDDTNIAIEALFVVCSN